MLLVAHFFRICTRACRFRYYTVSFSESYMVVYVVGYIGLIAIFSFYIICYGFFLVEARPLSSIRGLKKIFQLDITIILLIITKKLFLP